MSSYKKRIQTFLVNLYPNFPRTFLRAVRIMTPLPRFTVCHCANILTSVVYYGEKRQFIMLMTIIIIMIIDNVVGQRERANNRQTSNLNGYTYSIMNGKAVSRIRRRRSVCVCVHVRGWVKFNLSLNQRRRARAEVIKICPANPCDIFLWISLWLRRRWRFDPKSFIELFFTLPLPLPPSQKPIPFLFILEGTADIVTSVQIEFAHITIQLGSSI